MYEKKPRFSLESSLEKFYLKLLRCNKRHSSFVNNQMKISFVFLALVVAALARDFSLRPTQFRTSAPVDYPKGKLAAPYSFSFISSNVESPTELSYTAVPKDNLILLDSHFGIIGHACKKDFINFYVINFHINRIGIF